MARPFYHAEEDRQVASAQGLLKRLEGLRERVLDFVFTPRCVGCDTEGSYLCQPCLDGAQRLHGPYVPGRHDHMLSDTLDTGHRVHAVLSPFTMDGVIREAVHELKYGGLQALAVPLGNLMAEQAAALGISGDVMVSVPLHRSRQRQRGYNQAALLAAQAGKRMGIPVETAGLERKRSGDSQARSGSLQQRHELVREAFAARRRFDGERVLLIDDVCTSGATLNACSGALLQAGAVSVQGLTLAHEL